MANIQIPLPRVADKKIINFFKGLEKEHAFNTPALNIVGVDNSLPLGAPETQLLEDKNGYSLGSMTAVRNNHCTIRYQRSVDPNNSATPDRLTIDNNHNAVPAAEMLQITEYIEGALPRSGSALLALGDSTEKVLLSVIESHQRIVERLEESVGEISNKFAQERLRIQTEQDSFIRDKQAEFNDRETQLREEVTRERQELAAQKKDLDDRTNMHARRGIQAKIAERLQQHAEKFSLTAHTQRLRLPIHATVVALLLAIVALIYGYSAQTNEVLIQAIAPKSAVPPNLIYILLVKLSVLSIAGLGIVAWYIRWLNRWFEQHAAAEFNLKQFELDVNRASWVVETAMEWRVSEHGIIPSHLLDSISRNLFASRETSEDNNLHASDYLMSALLGNASKGRLKVGDAELEYSRGALKKAANSVDPTKS